jgi:hypothetical protein
VSFYAACPCGSTSAQTSANEVYRRGIHRPRGSVDVAEFDFTKRKEYAQGWAYLPGVEPTRILAVYYFS